VSEEQTERYNRVYESVMSMAAVVARREAQRAAEKVGGERAVSPVNPH
jgi:hypothetical protein